jgi:hypothetical protein
MKDPAILITALTEILNLSQRTALSFESQSFEATEIARESLRHIYPTTNEKAEAPSSGSGGSASPSVAILSTLLEFAEATKGMRPREVMFTAMGVINEMQRLCDEATDDLYDEAPPNDKLSD